MVHVAGITLDNVVGKLFLSCAYVAQLDTYSVPAPDVYGTGVKLGELDATKAGLELIMGSGGLLTAEPPYLGTLTCFDAVGNILWTYDSPNDSFAMGVSIGDIDGDGDNEIAVGYQVADKGATLLKKDGTFVWHYVMPEYCRCAEIGKVRNDYANQQMVLAGGGGVIRLLDEDGVLIWTKTQGVDPGGYPTIQVVSIMDMDGDGQAEIYFSQCIYIRKYDHLGNLIWSTNVANGEAPSPAVNTTYGMATGSLAGVNRIVAVCANGYCTMLDLNGNIIWEYYIKTCLYTVCIGDVDNDGNNEIVVGWGVDGSLTNCLGGVLVLDDTGLVIGEFDCGAAVQLITSGDANNDGMNEIVASCNDGKVYILRME